MKQFKTSIKYPSKTVENAWVVVRDGYYSAAIEYYSVLSQYNIWTADNMKALRLSRKKDAEDLISLLISIDHNFKIFNLRAEEHQWS